MLMPETAVLLVAGEGKRLRPLTETVPKCLVEVDGRPLLERALEALAGAGCRTAHITIGHLAEVVETRYGKSFAGMSLHYHLNAEYDRTNSGFSLELAIRNFEGPCWVLEGDVIFDPAILRRPSKGELSWYVDSTTRHLDGAYLTVAEGGRIEKMEIVRDLSLLQPRQAKSVGLLKLSAEGRGKLAAWLKAGLAEGRRNDYYDLFIRDHLQEAEVMAVDVAGQLWFEIDNHEDLRRATELFG